MWNMNSDPVFNGKNNAVESKIDSAIYFEKSGRIFMMKNVAAINQWSWII